jgi:hypothetical protein
MATGAELLNPGPECQLLSLSLPLTAPSSTLICTGDAGPVAISRVGLAQGQAELASGQKGW